MSYSLSINPQTNLSTKEGSVLMNLSKPSSGSSLNTSQSQLVDCPHSGPSSSLPQEQASLIVEQTDANKYTHDRYPQIELQDNHLTSANVDPFISKDEQNMEEGTYKRGHRRVKSKKKCFGTCNPLLIKPAKAPVLCLNLRTKMHKKTPETEVAKEISRCLHEPKYQLIFQVVKVLGNETALVLFHNTVEIQLNGGEVTAEGQRIKTPGGVFLTLVKKTASQEENRKIFQKDKATTRMMRRQWAEVRKQKAKENLDRLYMQSRDGSFSQKSACSVKRGAHFKTISGASVVWGGRIKTVSGGSVERDAHFKTVLAGSVERDTHFQTVSSGIVETNAPLETVDDTCINETSDISDEQPVKSGFTDMSNSSLSVLNSNDDAKCISNSSANNEAVLKSDIIVNDLITDVRQNLLQGLSTSKVDTLAAKCPTTDLCAVIDEAGHNRSFEIEEMDVESSLQPKHHEVMSSMLAREMERANEFDLMDESEVDFGIEFN